MFGAILVEPEDGLPAVDREFFLGQHELYTKGRLGQEGHHAFDVEAMKREEPTYVVFNGEAYAFTDDRHGPLHAETDERIRIFFANGGPNLVSSWHAIGNVWSHLYRDGDLLSEPARYVETTPVAPGTVTAAEIDTPVPGPIKIVDHALSRAARRGALGVIDVGGEPNPDVYDGGEEPEAVDGTGADRSFDGWMADVDNYDGVVDATGTDRVTVSVGAPGNGGAFGFDPAAVEISTGTTVVWEWTGEGGMHDVSHDGGTFASELTDEAGHTFEHPFDDTGTFKYACTPHEPLGMKGVVVVS
jgi:nitrite reductase (NO-forming)